MGERLAKGDGAAVSGAFVARAPARAQDRQVEHRAVGRHAAFERREVDEHLEGRARLALGLERAVELALGIGAAADDGADAAVRIHEHEAGLARACAHAFARERGLNQRLGPALQAAVDGGLDDDVAIGGDGERRQAIQCRIDRVVDTGLRAIERVGKAQVGTAGLGAILGGEQARIHHLCQHALGADADDLLVGGRRIAGGRLQQARQRGGLEHRHVAGGLAEEAARRHLDTVGAGAEIDAIEIELEDVALAETRLEPQSEHELLELAGERALGPEEKILGELLGQRRAALLDAPGAQVGERRAHQAGRVETPVLEEAAVLGGNDCIDKVPRQEVDGHVGSLSAALAQDGAVAGQDAHDGRARLGADRHGIGDGEGVVGHGRRQRERHRRHDVDHRQGEEADLPRPAVQELAPGSASLVGLVGSELAHGGGPFLNAIRRIGAHAPAVPAG